MGEVGKVGAGSLFCWVLGSGQRLKNRVNGRGRPWAVGSGSWLRAVAVAFFLAFAVTVRWAPRGLLRQAAPPSVRSGGQRYGEQRRFPRAMAAQILGFPTINSTREAKEA